MVLPTGNTVNVLSTSIMWVESIPTNASFAVDQHRIRVLDGSIGKWADTWEEMHRHTGEQGGVFPTLAAGPLNEIRTNLEAARAFIHTQTGIPVQNAMGQIATAPARPLAHV